VAVRRLAGIVYSSVSPHDTPVREIPPSNNLTPPVVHFTFHFAPGKGAKGCYQHFLSVSTYMSVRSHISKTRRPNFAEFSLHVACGSDSVSFDDSALHYVLPAL